MFLFSSSWLFYKYVHKCYPVIVTEQLIDNNQEQKLKQMIPIQNEQASSSIINEQQILSYDPRAKNTPVVLSTTKRYQSSQNKFVRSKTGHLPNTMQSSKWVCGNSDSFLQEIKTCFSDIIRYWSIIVILTKIISIKYNRKEQK